MLRWLALLCALLMAAPAAAHPAPFSYLNIHLRDGGIDGSLVVHTIDVAHILHAASPELLQDPNLLAPHRAEIEAKLAPQLMLRSDRPLPIQWTGLAPAPHDGAVRLTFRIPGAAPGALTVDANLFPYDPAHQTFVNVYEGDRLGQQWIFGHDSDPRTYYRGTTAGTWEVIKTFVPSGIHHILIGPDHIAFLIGLLLFGGRFRTLVAIVTAFTIGHSVTLSLAALDIYSPPSWLIEPAIALSIVFVGVDNLVRGTGRDLRAWAALAFGLVHGFGFANVLREFGLPQEALGWSLFSFNVGVELGQLAVVAVVASLLAAIRRYSPKAGYRVAVAGSVIVIGAGSFWFVQRVFLPGGV